MTEWASTLMEFMTGGTREQQTRRRREEMLRVCSTHHFKGSGEEQCSGNCGGGREDAQFYSKYGVLCDKDSNLGIFYSIVNPL